MPLLRRDHPRRARARRGSPSSARSSSASCSCSARARSPGTEHFSTTRSRSSRPFSADGGRAGPRLARRGQRPAPGWRSRPRSRPRSRVLLAHVQSTPPRNRAYRTANRQAAADPTSLLRDAYLVEQATQASAGPWRPCTCRQPRDSPDPVAFPGLQPSRCSTGHRAPADRDHPRPGLGNSREYEERRCRHRPGCGAATCGW